MAMLLMNLGDPKPPIFAFFVAFHILVVDQRRDFTFGTQVSRSDSQHTDYKPSLKVACLWSRDLFKILVPPMISPERLKLETSNFVQWFAV